MNIATTGNTIYAAIRGNAVSCAAIRTEFASLALSIATDANASARITSATINGQSFSSSGGITQGERLKLLRWIVACIDNGAAISSTQIPTF